MFRDTNRHWLIASLLAISLSSAAHAQSVSVWPEPVRVQPVNTLLVIDANPEFSPLNAGSRFGASSDYPLPYSLSGLPGAVAPLSSETDTQVLPVLRSGDGRIEALLFIDRGSDVVELNPVERLLHGRQLRTGPHSVGGALRLNASPNLSFDGDFRTTRSAGMALLCNEDIGLATTLSSLNEHCLLAQLGGGDDPLALYGSRRTSQQAIGTAFSFPDKGLDLSFGLSWLQSDPWLTVNDTSRTGLGYGTSVNLIPGLNTLSLRNQSLGVRGMIDLGSQRWLSLNGQISRNRVDRGVIDALMPTTWGSSGWAPTAWNTGRIGVGFGFGDFSGQVSGHVIDLAGSDALWGGLDIGVSWRTPWRAALTIGARNVISGGKKSWPSEDSKALDEAQSRIPYVQYQQDL